MLNYLDRGYIRGKIWFANLKENLISDERGVSGIVATVILVLLAVLLAAIFWNKLQSYFTTLWSQVTGEKFEKTVN